jgi:2-polyprenyl-6-methoxyphenol hydroxylase-like FAD-dependent oxidoreductase
MPLTMTASKTVDVLILGAGPVGLTLAAECQRHGVSFRIVDQNPSHSIHSKALAIWSNTIEHLAGLGLAEKFLAAGRPVRRGIFEDNGKRIAEIPITEGLDSPYPQPFILPQCDTEALLVEHLSSVGVEIERNTLALDVRPGEDSVEVDLQKPGAPLETAHARWLAGCDGARSLVRHNLPVEFPGVTEKMGFILADAKATGDLPIDGMLISSGAGGNVILFPVKSDVWRVFALRESGDDRSEPTLEEVQAHLDGAGLTRVRLSEPEWLSHFVVNERVATRNRVGRVFLLGDASHIHSPAGGQGMNTGMQDAFNLGWKLKLLTEGHGDLEAIAESYFAERHPIALQVVKETSNLLHFGVKSHAFIRAAKRLVLPLVSHSDTLKRTAAFQLSELGIAYTHSPLVEKESAAFHHFDDLEPGSLARDVEVFANGSPTSLWRQFLAPGHTLVVFSGPNPDAKALEDIVTSAAPARAIVIWHGAEAPVIDDSAVLCDPEGKAHARYGLAKAAGWYLIRPDQYIAARGGAAETALVSRYLKKIS